MSSSDWIALASALFACLAFGVSFVAYRLQSKTAKSDNEKELADQIDAINSQMAKMADLRSARSSDDQLNFADFASVNASVQTLLLRVGALIKSAGLTLDWYQNIILASAAMQIGDAMTAQPYAETAVELAGNVEDPGWDASTISSAQMVSLRMRASFYYNRGLRGDIDRARSDFTKARKVVLNSLDRLGPFLTSSQLIELYIREADFEIDLGNNDRGIELITKACQEWQKIQAPAYRQFTGSILLSFAHNKQALIQGKLLTDDFVRAWEEFHRGHNTLPAPVVGITNDPTSIPDLTALRPIKVADSPESGTLRRRAGGA